MIPTPDSPSPVAPSAVRYLGLDLGQMQDYSAAVVVEQTWPPVDPTMPGTSPVIEDFQVGMIWRPQRGTPYAAIVDYCQALLARPGMRTCAALVVDATGVGRPVVEMLRDAGLPPPVVAITITGGDTASQVAADEYRVPKRDLAGDLAVLLQPPTSADMPVASDFTMAPTARLRFARGLRLERVMRAELANFKVKITLSGHDQYEAGPAGEWREGEHDDLVLALALPIWYARHGHSLGSADAPGLPPILLGGSGWRTTAARHLQGGSTYRRAHRA